MIAYFVSDQQSDYYQSPAFTKVLTYVQQYPKTSVMKEKQTKAGLRLLTTFIHIKDIKTALTTLEAI